MKNKNIRDISNSLKNSKKNTFLSNIFKNNVLKNFKHLKNGYIKIVDGNNVYEVGNKSESLKCEINIISIDFYVFIGSGGLLGAKFL